MAECQFCHQNRETISASPAINQPAVSHRRPLQLSALLLLLLFLAAADQAFGVAVFTVPAGVSPVNLSAWLKPFTHHRGWVSLVTSPHDPDKDGSYSAGEGSAPGASGAALHRRLLLNSMYSLRTYGEQADVVFFALTLADFQACDEAKLACYDLRGVRPYSSGKEWEFDRFPRKFANMVAILDVLRHGVNVHVMEVGTVVLRPVAETLRTILGSRSWADGILDIDESGEHHPSVLEPTTSLVSTGTFALVANARTVNTIDTLLYAVPAGGGDWGMTRTALQAFLSFFQFATWDICWSPATCLSSQRHGLAALLRAPYMYNSTNQVITNDNVTFNTDFGTHAAACSARRLWARCLDTQCHHLHQTDRAITSLQLWLVNEAGTPLYPSGGAPHPYLPCPDRQAWTPQWLDPTSSWH